MSRTSGGLSGAQGKRSVNPRSEDSVGDVVTK